MKNVDMSIESIGISTDEGRKLLKRAKLIEGHGLENDHVRSESRQISIVSDKFIVNKTTIEVGFCHRKFKENLIIMHLDTKSLDILDKFMIGDAVIEISQVFKKCHSNCPKLLKNESCQANLEVAFAKVVKSGYIKVKDSMIKL